MKENIFNIFIFIDNNEEIALEYGVKCYQVEGDNNFKRDFLLSKVDDDFLSSKRFKFFINVNGQHIDTAKILFRVISNLMVLSGNQLFEEAFIFYEASNEPYRLITTISSGKPLKSQKSPKIPKNTFNALLSRGIDSVTSSRLIIEGYNLKKLSSLKSDQLFKLGLSEQYVNIFLKSPRPPIPDEIVIELLYKSKSTCCVCRDSSKPIIIHHIDEWSSSKNHSESNLIVLCLEHHDLAHSKKELSLNLTKMHLLKFKEKWIEKVSYDDSKTVLGIANSQYSRWDYVNVQRLFEMVFDMNIEYMDIKTYPILKSKKILNSLGTLEEPSNWVTEDKPNNFFTDISDAILINYYLKNLIERVIKKLPIIDITNRFTQSEIKALIKPGTYLSAQLGFYFQDSDEEVKKNHEIRKAYYQGNGIRIEFLFDSWYCTSSSAKYSHLTNHKIITPIILVKGIIINGGNITINGSCLAIGSWFDNLKVKRGEEF